MNYKRPPISNILLEIARVFSNRSICPDGKRHGAVLATIDGRILSIGYNGPATGESHCIECTLIGDKIGKDWRTCPAVHAEENAVANAARNGVKVEGAVLYCTKAPCERCARILKNAGVTKIINRRR